MKHCGRALARPYSGVCVISSKNWNLLFCFLKNQLIIAGFGIEFHAVGNAGKLSNDDLAGGIDDAAHA